MDLINTLHREMVEHRGLNAQRKVIEEMVSYAATHFAMEEKLMRKVGFDGMAAHVRAHAAFAGKAGDLRRRADNDGFILSAEILDFLKDWLIKHIMGVDRLYVDCFTKSGVH